MAFVADAARRGRLTLRPRLSPWLPSLLCCLALSACAGSDRARISYPRLGQRELRLPTVAGTVHGRPTLLVVDTGAQLSSVAAWLVKELHLPTVTTHEQASATGGESFAFERLDRPGLGVSGWRRRPAERPAVVIPMPGVLVQLGIGAILSPQQIDPGAAVVLDFAAGTLERMSRADGHARLRAATHGGAPSWVAAPCDPGEGGLSFEVAATVGGQPTRLEVDTGANATVVVSESAAGRALASSAAEAGRTGTASGAVHAGRVARAVDLTVGADRARVDVSILPGRPSAECHAEGQLGMDVLDRCLLVITRDAIRAACAPR